ncbi:hypothetical protein [Nocardia terpenica]|nr:hypothetical protein [Nocardia terpenica]
MEFLPGTFTAHWNPVTSPSAIFYGLDPDGYEVMFEQFHAA